MKQFLISTCFFMLIIYVDSMIELESTIPHGNSFPAFILKNNFGKFGINRPGVPNDIKPKPGTTDVMMLKFESFDKKVKAIENASLSYYCPADENVLELERSDKIQCETELQVVILKNGSTCGNENREQFNIGYGMDDEGIIGKHFPFFSGLQNSKKEKRVQYSLFTSCFDESEDRAYAVIYEFKRRNNLYHQSSTIYPQKQLEDILKRHSSLVAEMMEKLKRIQAKKQKTNKKIDLTDLIPFQLISHEDMILYNWKLTTFNEKNYSFIWKNIAENSWKTINEYFRNFMITCNPDLDVSSGVHDYTEEGYPRYIWKHIHHHMLGMTVIIHNHPTGDTEDYPHLCQGNDYCEGFAFLANQKDKNLGLFYCCPTSSLKDKILYFKDKSDLGTLDLGQLRSVYDEADPHLPETVVHKPVIGKTDSSARPSSSTPDSSGIYARNPAAYDKNTSKPEVTNLYAPKSHQPVIPNFNKATDGEVGNLRNQLDNWMPSTVVAKKPENSS